MNSNVNKKKNGSARWGLRLCSLAVAGIALGAVQGPSPSAVAEDASASGITIHEQSAWDWTAGDYGFLDDVVFYAPGDLPLKASIDWGDGHVSTGSYDGSDLVTSNGTLSFTSTYTGDAPPGDQEVALGGLNTYGQPGSYPMSVTVVDSQGDTVTAQGTNEVAGVPKPVDPSARPAGQVISLPLLKNRTYGDSFYLPATGGGSGNPVVISSSTPSVCTTAGTNGMLVHMVGSGVCTVVANQAGSADYAPAASTTDSLYVRKATLVVSANDQTKKAGDIDPAFTLKYDGLVNGDSPSVVSGVRTSVWDQGLDDVVAHNDPGTYVIRTTGGTAANYTLDLRDGTLTVNPLIFAQATGLPSTLAQRAVNVNGAWVSNPYRSSVPYGSRLTVWFWPVLRDAASGGPIYSTTAKTAVIGSETANSAWYADYSTIPVLINTAAGPNHADLASSLSLKWGTIEYGLNNKQGTSAMPAFAKLVRQARGVWMSTRGADDLLAHLQVIYTTYGGVGQL